MMLPLHWSDLVRTFIRLVWMESLASALMNKDWQSSMESSKPNCWSVSQDIVESITGMSMTSGDRTAALDSP